MFGCKVNIIDAFDLNRYPGWCKAVLKDCNGAEHILIDKLPVIGLEEKEVSSLPIDKEENIRFYTERFGFKIIGKEKDGTVVVYQFQLNR